MSKIANGGSIMFLFHHKPTKKNHKNFYAQFYDSSTNAGSLEHHKKAFQQ